MSERCLQCHGTNGDRVQARSDRPVPVAGAVLLGGSLDDDHPLGAAESSLMALSAARIDDLQRVDGGAFPLMATLAPGETIECTSCHDPHDPWLITQQTHLQDQTCLQCHDPMRDQGSHGIANCGTCHRVHGSPDLEHFTRELDPNYLCGACHQGAAVPLNPGIEPIPAPPVHAEPASTQCSECHQIH